MRGSPSTISASSHQHLLLTFLYEQKSLKLVLAVKSSFQKRQMFGKTRFSTWAPKPAEVSGHLFAIAQASSRPSSTNIGHASNISGSEVFDGYFMSYSHFPEVSSLGLAEHLNERIRNDNDRLKWEDVLPKVRAMGEYRKDGVTNLDFLMYDGRFALLRRMVDLVLVSRCLTTCFHPR